MKITGELPTAAHDDMPGVPVAPEPTPATAAPEAPGLRIWTRGYVALLPIESPHQIQPFADWGASCLYEEIGEIGTPPKGYTAVTYGPASRRFPASIFQDHFE